MKNKKLNLNELKVKSFVTDFEKIKENTIKGGGTAVSCVLSACYGGPCDPNTWFGAGCDDQ